jgi:hypothetical protein
LAGDPDEILQVADILDITDDVLLGAPKRPHPSPKTSPEIQKTLHWIQNTLDDEESKTYYGKAETRVNLMPQMNGCQVTFVYETMDNWKLTYRIRNKINLGDLDPTSLTSNVISHDVVGPVSMVRVHTTDKAQSVSLSINDLGWEPALVIPATDLNWEFPSDYAERFVKALHRAITLCGGKASAF